MSSAGCRVLSSIEELSGSARIDLLVSYGDRIALVGHNGSGKSTLIDVLLGRTEPTQGVALARGADPGRTRAAHGEWREPAGAR